MSVTENNSAQSVAEKGREQSINRNQNRIRFAADSKLCTAYEYRHIDWVKVRLIKKLSSVTDLDKFLTSHTGPTNPSLFRIIFERKKDDLSSNFLGVKLYPNRSNFLVFFVLVFPASLWNEFCSSTIMQCIKRKESEKKLPSKANEYSRC